MSMIDPNDQRLTAYALDEMSATERAEFETLLRDDPAARATIEDIRRTMAALGEALAQEPLPARAVELPVARSHWVRHLFAEQWTFWVPLGAAAGFALFFWSVYLPGYNRRLDAQHRADQRAHQQQIAIVTQFPQLVASTPPPAPAVATAEHVPAPAPTPGFNTADANTIQPNYFLTALQNPLSTFALQVDSAAYGDVRRFLQAGERPPTGLVRIEELVNAFHYRYPQPAGPEPIAVSAELRPAPWAADHKLVRIALQGREPTAASATATGGTTVAEATPPRHPNPVAQAEARRFLTDQAGAAIQTIAHDVKVQVEFNPAKVLAYRLIGYENRLLKGDDFARPADGGTIGAGHAVTALYEIIPAGAKADLPAPPELKYQHPTATTAAATNEWLTVKLRYKTPGNDTAKAAIVPLHSGRYDDEKAADPDFQFAAAVAGFGMLLQDNPFKGGMSWDMVEKLAESGVGSDEDGYRKEFVSLVKKARALDPATPPAPAPAEQ
jgi:hypothetical protein